MNDPFSHLPDEIVIEIALFKPFANITRLCQSSAHFNNVICNNNIFWRQKFILDFGNPPVNIISWKNAYLNYGKVFYFGAGHLKTPVIQGPRSEHKVPIEIPKIRAKSVDCGETHTVLISLNNDVLSFGRNENGQLGLGDNDIRYTPTILPNIKAKAVSCGDYHTALIDLDNNILVFGNNEWGHLGFNEDIEYIHIPTKLENVKAKSISCGGFHTMFIGLDDELWGFGNNREGQLGLGTIGVENTPRKIGIKARQVACGSSHTVIIDFDDNLWGWGSTQDGQLALENFMYVVPTQILSDAGENLKAKFVTCGSDCTMIIDLDDNVLVFGNNMYGQLGLGDMINRNVPTILTVNDKNLKAKNISSCVAHTMIIDLDDNVWGFGSNSSGQLGLGDNADRFKPTQIPNLKAKTLACGNAHTVVISNSGANEILVDFDEVHRMLNSGHFRNFNFLPEYQIIPHNPNNYIATFFGKDGNIYLAELHYDQTTNQIFPPI